MSEAERAELLARAERYDLARVYTLRYGVFAPEPLRQEIAEWVRTGPTDSPPWEQR